MIGRRALLTAAAVAPFAPIPATARTAAMSWTLPRGHTRQNVWPGRDTCCDPYTEHETDMLAAGTSYLGGPEGYFGVPSVQEGARLLTGCVLRFRDPEDGPYLHVNGNHASVGITGLERDGADLLIRTDSGISGKWAIVYPPTVHDETLARRGILCGISGGIGTLRVRFTILTATGPEPLSILDPRLYDPVNDVANLWVGVEAVKVSRAWVR